MSDLPDAGVLGNLQRGGPDGTKIKANSYNIDLILSADPYWVGRFYYDELARGLRLDGEPIPNTIGAEVAVWCGRVYNVDFPMSMVDRVVDLVAARRRIHPVAEWLKTLVWDGTPRLGRWLQDYAGVEDKPLYRAYGSRWLMQATMRALRPGCQADSVLIFFSDRQGIGKSTMFRALAGVEWFNDSPISIGDAQKQGMALRGVWIHELAELSSLRSKAQDAIKHFVTVKSDNYRPPYGRRVENNPRTTCFGGTTNSPVILSDPTGSRRFFIVEVGTEGPMRVEDMRRDRDQVFAEAMHRIRSWLAGHGLSPEDLRGLSEVRWSELSSRAPDDVRWWLTTAEDTEREEREVETYKNVDPVELVLDEIVAQHDCYTSRQILELLRHVVTPYPGVFARIAPMLRARGWRAWRAKTMRGWRAGTHSGRADAAPAGVVKHLEGQLKPRQ